MIVTNTLYFSREEYNVIYNKTNVFKLHRIQLQVSGYTINYAAFFVGEKEVFF